MNEQSQEESHISPEGIVVEKGPEHSKLSWMKGKVGWILGILVIAVIAALLVSGYLAVVWKQPSDHVAIVTPRACGDDVVTTYNDVSQYKQRDGKDDYTIDEQGLKRLAAQIKDKAGYQRDPTCQTILFMAAVDDKDYATAKATYKTLNDLHAEGKYADSNLGAGGPLSTYKVLLDEMSPSNKAGSKKGFAGGR